MANFLYLKDLEKKWTSTENHPDTQSLLEADVEAVATVLVMATGLSRPGKSREGPGTGRDRTRT